jgi:hypothetical protein
MINRVHGTIEMSLKRSFDAHEPYKSRLPAPSYRRGPMAESDSSREPDRSDRDEHNGAKQSSARVRDPASISTARASASSRIPDRALASIGCARAKEDRYLEASASISSCVGFAIGPSNARLISAGVRLRASSNPCSIVTAAGERSGSSARTHASG